MSSWISQLWSQRKHNMTESWMFAALYTYVSYFVIATPRNIVYPGRFTHRYAHWLLLTSRDKIGHSMH